LPSKQQQQQQQQKQKQQKTGNAICGKQIVHTHSQLLRMTNCAFDKLLRPRGTVTIEQ
jgi:hypothetical protein